MPSYFSDRIKCECVLFVLVIKRLNINKVHFSSIILFIYFILNTYKYLTTTQIYNSYFH